MPPSDVLFVVTLWLHVHAPPDDHKTHGGAVAVWRRRHEKQFFWWLEPLRNRVEAVLAEELKRPGFVPPQREVRKHC